MVAYTKAQQRKKKESERLRGERDQIKFIDLRFERWQAVWIDREYSQAHLWSRAFSKVQIRSTKSLRE